MEAIYPNLTYARDEAIIVTSIIVMSNKDTPKRYLNATKPYKQFESRAVISGHPS